MSNESHMRWLGHWLLVARHYQRGWTSLLQRVIHQAIPFVVFSPNYVYHVEFHFAHGEQKWIRNSKRNIGRG
jgi:hypothetical protein